MNEINLDELLTKKNAVCWIKDKTPGINGFYVVFAGDGICMPKLKLQTAANKYTLELWQDTKKSRNLRIA